MDLKPNPNMNWEGFTIASAYVLIHAVVHFYFATTLSVALSSGANGALLTVLIASNFVELKGSMTLICPPCSSNPQPDGQNTILYL